MSAGKAKKRKPRTPAGGSTGYAARAAKAQYDEGKHPRDAHGHWIVTGGGYRRQREGTDQRRQTLARAIKGARGKLKNNAEHTALTLRLRGMRAARRGQKTTIGRPRPSIDQVRRQVADRAEKKIADATGGKRLKDYEAMDVHVPRAGGTGKHVIEVKTMQFGSKPSISVHPAAFVRKIDHARKNKDDVFHTVVMDLRATSEGGAHAGKYSGHEIYYKRASGPYSLSKMHKVKDMAELKSLMEAPANRLPKAARGVFPKGEKLAALRAQGAKDREYNNARSKEYKAKKGPAAYGR